MSRAAPDFPALFSACVFSEAGVAPALADIGEALNSEMVLLLCLEREAMEAVASRGSEPRLEDFYRSGWEAHDLRNAVARKERPIGLWFDHQGIPAQVRAKSAFFQEFCRPEHLYWNVSVGFTVRGRHFGISVLRREGAGPFSTSEGAPLLALAPVAAAYISTAALRRDAALTTAASALDAAGHAAVVLDDWGVVMHATPSSVAVFDSAFGVRDGRLFARHAPSQAKLAALGRNVRSGVISVERGAGRGPVLCSVIETPPDAPPFLPGARTLLMLDDVDQRPTPAASKLAEIFGFSPAQARVGALLAQGMGIREIAYRAGLSESYTRQLVKQVIAKSQTGRQAAFVALCAKLGLWG